MVGAVDQNTFNGSYEQWRSWLAAQTGLRAAPVAAGPKPADERGAKQLMEEDPATLPASEKGAGSPTPPAPIDNVSDKGQQG
jgi:lysozyme